MRITTSAQCYHKQQWLFVIHDANIKIILKNILLPYHYMVAATSYNPLGRKFPALPFHRADESKCEWYVRPR